LPFARDREPDRRNGESFCGFREAVHASPRPQYCVTSTHTPLQTRRATCTRDAGGGRGCKRAARDRIRDRPLSDSCIVGYSRMGDQAACANAPPPATCASQQTQALMWITRWCRSDAAAIADDMHLAHARRVDVSNQASRPDCSW
jgi:hypothetical protein